MKMIRSILFVIAMLVATSLPAFADSVVTPTPAAGSPPTVTSVVTTPAAGAGGSTTTISTQGPTVQIPWGNWLDAAINQIVVPILSAIVLGALSLLAIWITPLLPSWMRGIITQKNIVALDQLIVPSLATGLKAVGSDVSGKSINFGIKDAAITAAANYAIDHGSAALIKWAGGPEGIRQKIQARFDMLDTGVTAQTTATITPAGTVSVTAPAIQPIQA